MSRFPVAFRLPAFASRSSDSRRGIGPSLRSAYRPTARTSTGLPRFARTSCDRGGCLLYPEDGGAHPDWARPRPAPAASRRPVPAPRSSIPSAGLPITRHQQRFTQFTRPVFPSPVAPGWNGRPWAFPRASNPAGQEPTTHVRAGTGHEHGPGTTLSTSAEPPIRAFTRNMRPRVARDDRS